MGTRIGGLKASKTNKELYGEDFYGRIGKIGGQKSRGGGFASMPKWKISEAGARGGRISRRSKRAI